MRALHLSIAAAAVARCHAALSLPTPAFLPPPSASGAVTSPSKVPNQQWATLLGNLLYFYDAQRSGKISDKSNRVPWRNDSALNDGHDVGLDLNGGFYDAGDYIKCTFPLSFTLTSICWGAMDFGSGYEKANQTAYLDSMLRWGLDWLIKAHPQPTTLFVQVADGNLDNAYWGGDLGIPQPRPSYQINSTSPGTDAASAASAAFSSCSALYAGRSLSTSGALAAPLTDLAYSQALLNHSQQLYSFAVNTPQRTYQTSVPAAGIAYPSSGYADELTMAALFLSFATNSSSMCAQAQQIYQKNSLAGSDAVFNWDSKTPGLAVLFAQIASINPGICGNLTLWQNEAERYFDLIVSRQAGHLTRGGLLFYDGDSDDASLNPALNAAMLLARYAPIATTQDKRTSYMKFARDQVDYVLGKNPMSVPYVVGVNPNSPANPHSAMASGGNDIDNIDTSPPQEAYILYGAVVGGPGKDDLFYDIRHDWPQTEVALDYNAPLLTLAAMNVLDNPDDPYYTALAQGRYQALRPSGTPCDAAFNCGSRGSTTFQHRLSNAQQIAMAVIVGVVGLSIGTLAAYWLYLCVARK